MKYCPECGRKIEGNKEFCECGYRIPGEWKEFPLNSEEGTEEYSTEGRKILIEYSEKTLGPSVSCQKYILYTFSEEKLLLEEYSEEGSKQKRHILKLIPYQAYEDALAVVKGFHLKELLGRMGSPIKGKEYAILFRMSEEEEELYCFSSENIGEKDTMMMFPEMWKVLLKYR